MTHTVQLSKNWELPPRVRPGSRRQRSGEHVEEDGEGEEEKVRKKRKEVKDGDQDDIEKKMLAEKKKRQNRDAQRAYRERKANKIQSLEEEVKRLDGIISLWQEKYELLEKRLQLQSKTIEQLEAENKSLRGQKESNIEPQQQQQGDNFQDPMLNSIIDNFKPMEAVILKTRTVSNGSRKSPKVFKKSPLTPSSINMSNSNSYASNIEVPLETTSSNASEGCVFSGIPNFTCACKSLKVDDINTNLSSTSPIDTNTTANNTLVSTTSSHLIAPENTTGNNDKPALDSGKNSKPEPWSCCKNCTNLFEDVDEELLQTEKKEQCPNCAHGACSHHSRKSPASKPEDGTETSAPSSSSSTNCGDAFQRIRKHMQVTKTTYSTPDSPVEATSQPLKNTVAVTANGNTPESTDPTMVHFARDTQANSISNALRDMDKHALN